MICRRTVFATASYWFVAFLWLVAGEPRSWGADMPETIRAALESNAKALSPIAASWERTRSSDLSPPRFLAVLKYPSGELLARWKCRFMWDNGRFYSSEQARLPRFDQRPDGTSVESTTKPLDDYDGETTFDGKSRYNGTKGSSFPAPILSIDPLESLMKRQPEVRFISTDFFRELGFHIPDRPSEYAVKAPAKSLPLYLIERGATVSKVEHRDVGGTSCTMILLQNQDGLVQFTLDNEKNYAVRERVERTRSGEPAAKVTCSDFEQVPESGLWMPRQVGIEWHIWPGVLDRPLKDVVIRETYAISSLTSEPIPPEQFVLRYDKPGTAVSDGNLPGAEEQASGRISYRVPADPKNLDEVIRVVSSQNYRVKWRLPAIFIINGVLLLAIVMMAIRRRRSHPVDS
jgi:hypothetical protein